MLMDLSEEMLTVMGLGDGMVTKWSDDGEVVELL